MTLSEHDIERYSRQLILPGFGAEQQRALLAAKVAVTGDFPVLERYLRAAGMKLGSSPHDADVHVRTDTDPAGGAAIDLCLSARSLVLTRSGTDPIHFALPDSGSRRTLEAAAAALLLRRFFRSN